VLECYLDLLNRQTEGKRQVKEAELALDSLALARYKSLTVEEIKTLVVEDKWLAALEQAVQAEVEKANQRLTNRIKELAERYETPLPELSASVEELERKVAAHLAKMGFEV
jgi:type I restriction enzyme M protein